MFLILASTIGGVVVGWLLWWLITTAWSRFEDWWWPSVGSGSGGDPIGNWADGVIRMLAMSSFLIFGGLAGLDVGLRLTFSGASTWKECLVEVRRWRREAKRDGLGHGRFTNQCGRMSLFAGTGAVFVLNAAFRVRPLVPVSSAVPAALLLLAVGAFSSITQLLQSRRRHFTGLLR